MPHFLDMLDESACRSKPRARTARRVSVFIENPLPFPGQTAMMSLNVRSRGPADRPSIRGLFVSVAVPCRPSARARRRSANRAHNQRGVVRVKLELGPFFWIEDLVRLSGCASSAVYSLLKREDEKYVTEASYDNPKFVEDLVRDVILAIPPRRFSWYSVEAENFETFTITAPSRMPNPLAESGRTN
jgi:GTP cyclohydrolase I